MNNKKLFEILSIVNEVSVFQWSQLRNIVDTIKQKKSTVIESQWADQYKIDNPDYYPLDLSEISTWSTLHGCYDLLFYLEAGKLICKVKLWNGDSFGAYRTSVRFTAKIMFHYSFISNIEQEILYAFDKFSERAYEEYEKAKKRNWIAEFKTETIKKL